MTSCFHVLGRIRIQAIGELFTVTRQVAPGAKSAILELPCYHQMRVFISCAAVNKIWASLFAIKQQPNKKQKYRDNQTQTYPHKRQSNQQTTLSKSRLVFTARLRPQIRMPPDPNAASSECPRTSCPTPSSERAQIPNFRTRSIPN